jgi:hypothetical protein
VHDTRPVRNVERVGHLARDPQRVADGELSLAGESRAQRLARCKRRDVIQQLARLSRVEQRDDVRMRELRRDPNLAQETLGAEHRAELRVEHLDCDVAPVANVARKVDTSHTATTNLALDAVALVQCRDQ